MAALKPRIRKMIWIHGETVWCCGVSKAATNACGYGLTPREAYKDWMRRG